MIKVQKLNVQLQIKDNELDSYENRGFTKVTAKENANSGKSEYELLKEEALALGLEVKKNISKANLLELIEQKKQEVKKNNIGQEE